MAEAAPAAELQHPDGGGGRPQQQLHLPPQRHPEPHQRRDQQGAAATPALYAVAQLRFWCSLLDIGHTSPQCSAYRST